jgi:uncharacterized SAM-binding protein YcdF (DUF218 family)
MILTRRGCLVLSVVLSLLSSVACAVPASQVGSFLTSVDRLSRADAIVVLGSADTSRAMHAVDLFNQGYAPRVVFSGSSSRRYGTAKRAEQTALDAGLPASAALLSDHARNTYQEAKNLSQLAQQKGWHTLIVVTDALHTRRASRTFRTLLPGVTIYLSAAPNPRYDPARWWESRSGRSKTVHEVLGLGFYWIYYGIRPF